MWARGLGTSIVFAFAVMACARPEPQDPIPVPLGARVVFSGHVADADDYQPLQNVGLELSFANASNRPIAAAVTDDKGEFKFTNLDPGYYVLRVGRPGYNEQRLRVEVLRSDQKPLEVRMRSLRTRCVSGRYHVDCP
jgi:hypothetical protein